MNAPSPSKSEQIESNPLYGRADGSISSGLQSPSGSLHICDNSLYTLADIQKLQGKISEEETQFGNGGLIYEEPVFVEAGTTSLNMSNESLNITPPGKELKNPLYGKSIVTPPQGATTPPLCFCIPPPVYSVPRPASDINSPLHSSHFDHNSVTKYPGYETATSLSADTSKAEVYYESIDDRPLLPPLLLRNTAKLPSSQDGSYSYDQLHYLL